MWWPAASTRDCVDTLRTYGAGAGYTVDVADAPDGVGGIPASVSQDVAAVVVQHPNVFGAMEDVRAWAGVAHAAGARLIQIFDPTSLGVLAPPGELGADIAVAEGQPLGNHLAFGGPYLGILAARMADVRRMPGRIVGATVDAKGRTGYVLTLQAREQHIRREKATSNICTNQTLMALAATIYLAWLGPEGYRELGEQCAAKAAYAYERLCAATRRRARVPRGGGVQGVRAPAVATGGRGVFAAGGPGVPRRRPRRVGRARGPPRGRDRTAHAVADRRVRGRTRGGAGVSDLGAPVRRTGPPGGGTIKEISRPGRRASSFPALDVPAAEIDPAFARTSATDLPEVGELDLVRHYTRLSQQNYGLDTGFYPLGSCSMKYNPKVAETAAAFPGLLPIAPAAAGRDHPGHPRAPLAARGGAVRDHGDGPGDAATARRRVW